MSFFNFIVKKWWWSFTLIILILVTLQWIWFVFFILLIGVFFTLSSDKRLKSTLYLLWFLLGEIEIHNTIEALLSWMAAGEDDVPIFYWGSVMEYNILPVTHSLLHLFIFSNNGKIELCTSPTYNKTKLS